MATPDKNIVRKIIHIDMDAFYASVEQRDNPELSGKAIAVGGLPEMRGVVMTASYEARQYGVRSAMPSKTAIRLCPHLQFVPPRFLAYREVSNRIHQIFHRYTDIIEPLSLDEAYLDVTKDKLNIGSAIEIAQQIRQSIKQELQLTASAGVSVNKFVAKIASDLNKPDGYAFIGPSAVEAFMEKLAIEKFYGVGKVTAEKMKAMGLYTGADLKRLSEQELVRNFGKTGHFYYQIVRGIDEREVQPFRETKSISAEDTFITDLEDIQNMMSEIDRLSKIVAARIQNHGLKGRTVTVKLKFADYKQIPRSLSIQTPMDEAEIISATARQILQMVSSELRPVRLLGVGISNFSEPSTGSNRNNNQEQLDLFV